MIKIHTSTQWQDIFPNELQKKKDIECHDTIMNTYPNYLKIWWYKVVKRFKTKLKRKF
ncbi:MAG TPA: hypothetical protein VLA74_03610 [Nitrososphaeraceae archaeon]|jgi:hypothetical protein|nr:hypothetical protein [Nitrososphaeraceae archaeon]